MIMEMKISSKLLNLFKENGLIVKDIGIKVIPPYSLLSLFFEKNDLCKRVDFQKIGIFETATEEINCTFHNSNNKDECGCWFPIDVENFIKCGQLLDNQIKVTLRRLKYRQGKER